MKKSEYLYGEDFDARTLSEMNYVDALYHKVHLSKELVAALVAAHFTETDWVRIAVVSKAISFNQALIREAEGKDEEV